MDSPKEIFSINTFNTHRIHPFIIPPDFCIILEEESIPVHKEVLTSTSHYFHCLFESGMREAQNQTLILHDLDPHHNLNPHVVKTVVQYMYGKDITIEWDNVADCLDVVESWQITELKDKLENYIRENIAKNIGVDNCINWSFIAQRYCMKKVQSRIDEFMTSSFASVTASSVFLSLKFSELKELFTYDMMMNVSCDDKFCAIVNWIFVNEADRKDSCKDLLDHIGLLKCSHGFLQLVVGSYQKNASEDDCQSAEPYASKLLAWTYIPEADKGKTIITLGDKPKKHLPNKNILQFDFDKNTIEEIGSLPDIFVGSYPARCSTPYGMFSGGGGDSKYEGSVTCALLDVPSMAYLRLPDLPVSVADAGAVFANGKVYVLGGCRTTNLMHCLDLQTLHWSPCANLPQPSNHPTVCSVGNMIYANILVHVNLSVDFVLLTYSTLNDVWSIEKGFATKYQFYSNVDAAVPVGLKFYVLVTSNQKSRCIQYDSFLQQWKEHAEFPGRSDFCTAVYTDKKIVVCGTLPRIDVYDIQCDEWEESSLKMPQKIQNIFMMTL